MATPMKIPNKPIIAGKTKGPDVITLPIDTRPGKLGHLRQGLLRFRRGDRESSSVLMGPYYRS